MRTNDNVKRDISIKRPDVEVDYKNLHSLDYTQWRQANLHDDIPVEMLNQQALDFWDNSEDEVWDHV